MVGSACGGETRKSWVREIGTITGLGNGDFPILTPLRTGLTRLVGTYYCSHHMVGNSVACLFVYHRTLLYGVCYCASPRVVKQCVYCVCHCISPQRDENSPYEASDSRCILLQYYKYCISSRVVRPCVYCVHNRQPSLHLKRCLIT